MLSDTKTQVQISWSLPLDDGGLEITSYIIQIESSTGDFYRDLTNCDAEHNQEIISTRTCSIPIESLKASPFNLSNSDKVNATVISINLLGDSDVSNVGDGAIIPPTLGAPQDLIKDRD